MARPKRRRNERSGASPVQVETFPWSESIAYLLRDTYKAFAQALKQELDQHDVNIGGWVYLRVLWTEDGLTQRELTRRAGLMQPNTNAALKQLARRGLIRQTENPNDRRSIHIFLTPQGRALGHRLIPAAKRIRERALVGFKPREIALLRTMLGKMKQNLAGAADSDDAGRPIRRRTSKSAGNLAGGATSNLASARTRRPAKDATRSSSFGS